MSPVPQPGGTATEPTGDRPEPDPFAGLGGEEQRPRTAVERVRALEEDERRRDLLALGRVSIIIGSLGLVVAALTLSSLLAPESGLLPGRAEVNAARLSPEGRHNLALVIGPIEAALGLAGLAVGGRVLSRSRGLSRGGQVAGAAGAVAGLLTLGAAVLLFFLA